MRLLAAEHLRQRWRVRARSSWSWPCKASRRRGAPSSRPTPLGAREETTVHEAAYTRGDAGTRTVFCLHSAALCVSIWTCRTRRPT